MQKSLLIALCLLVALPSVSLGAYNDATLTTDVVLSVGGVTLNITGSSAAVASITVDSSTFSFTLEGGSSLQVTSPTGKVLSTNGTAYITVNTCVASQSVLKHALVAGSATVTITPQSYPCGSSATNSGAGVASSGGGGGGGGGGGTPSTDADAPIIYPIVQNCPTGFTCTLVTPLVPNCPVGFSCKLANPAAVVNASPVASIAGVSAIFSARLTVGIDSQDVTRLQKLLASDKSVYPEGRVTGYFGPLTRKAVENFQVKYGVAKAGDVGFGTVGPMTRAMLKKVFVTQ